MNIATQKVFEFLRKLLRPLKNVLEFSKIVIIFHKYWTFMKDQMNSEIVQINFCFKKGTISAKKHLKHTKAFEKLPDSLMPNLKPTEID